MQRGFIDRLKRTGLLSLAGVVAVVSVLFNIYQFSVNTKMQRDAQKLQLNENWWGWVNRAKHLDAQRDSMVSVFLAEHNRAWELASRRSRQKVTDSLSASVEKLRLASSIWERQAQMIAEAMTFIERQLDMESEDDSSGWVSRELLRPPPRLLAYEKKPFRPILPMRTALQVYASALGSATDPKAIEAAYDEWDWITGSWDVLTKRLVAPDNRKGDKP